METIINKAENLEIDISDITKWPEIQESSSIDETHHQHDLHFSTTPIKHHKRAASESGEYATTDILPTRQSLPDLKEYIHKNSFCSNKKKWFQIPRMTLRRQQSTPPRSGLGGLKAGSVEPPDPPPQLLFNLDWSTPNLKGSSTTTLWDNNDVKQLAESTPATPATSRRSSVISTGLFSPEADSFRHKKSLSMSCVSAIVSEEDSYHVNPRSSSISDDRNSSQETTSDATNTTLKPKYCNTSTRLFSIIPIHPRPNIKRGSSSEDVLSHPSLSTSTSSSSLSSLFTPPPSPPLSKNGSDYKIQLFNVYVPNTNEQVLNFGNIQSRKVKLKRKNNLKSEQKALHEWQTELLIRLNQSFSVPHRDNTISPAKKARYFLSRHFILQEFFTTEITFWNQLNFTKVIFCDPLKLALERGSISARPCDLDWFANLPDLMSFSSTLIYRLGRFQMDQIPGKNADNDPNNQADQVNIGLILREMAESMIVFLRCALDFKHNKKRLNQKKNTKGYALYNEKLALRKETRQFTLDDYLIIPIQRVARYNLLLTDLEKHTESSHPDYKNIRIALCIIQSLASAMNAVQN